MPLKPIFQWSAVAGADSYELVLSTAPSLANPTIVKSGEHALPGTAWQCDVNLSYDTAYYWKVRAVNADTFSDWSAVGAFITEPPPSPVSLSPSPSGESAPLPLPLPPPPSQQTAPDWSIYLMWLMGLIIILLLIITLMLVMKIRRP